LIACIGMTLVSYAGLGLSHTLYGALFYYGLTLVRGLHAPLLHHEEQRLLPSSDRAGFLSFRNFLFRGSYVVLGPLIGVCVEHYGQHPVLLACGALVVMAQVLSVRAVLAKDR
jgi:hypothetical protein